MTDIIIDDDIIDTSKTTTSGSNSSITATRRPMFIETEVRTDTVTKRRVGSTTASRSVYDILQSTKSPTDGRPPTTYTYAHSVSYMPVTESGSCDVPVMARRDLHGDYSTYGSRSFSSSNQTTFSSPARFMSNVKSQLVNSYSALRDRLTHHNNTDEHASTLLNSPSTQGGARYTRSSSQSSTNGTSSGYHLRRRAPVHSTPRDNDIEELKTTSKQRKDRQSQDSRQEDQDDEVEEEQDEKHHKEKHDHDDRDSLIVRLIKRILHLPLDILSFVWNLFFGLPWWLLLPLLLLLGFYVFPNLACKPFEHYPESKLYQGCRNFQEYTNNVTNNGIHFIEEHTYKRGLHNLNRFYHKIIDVKDSIANTADDVLFKIKKTFHRKVDNVKDQVSDVVGTTKDSVKEYCDAGLDKVNGLIEELKREKEKYLGGKHALKPAQEQEYEHLIRVLLDEYAADETGQADYALEANGGKIVDTRCTEYTDEPRQNVVKFLGIPIVHMSKQPNIMIKAGRMPGQCFPFKGDHGSVLIKLAVPVKPSEFTIEHLSKSISIVGHINSAPNNFTVYALKDKNDKEGIVLGRYFYDAENGPSLQRFKPQLVNVPIVEYIEVRVTSNWGNPNYTCVYRFRVHGDLQTVQPSAPPAA
ncbi:unnamed protein product [Adineta steineri]|uniref:SUN domain-containing protein n=1 Tax=Adineta steineri TaxID=433720 RepID=A0A814SKW5_9BILA|nr:unnamed protein product [Adineta steineri]CAF4009509.1 unnamed protein product [Adineta steineri]